MTISNVQSNILWEFMDSPLLLLIFSLIPKRELPAKEKFNYMLSKRITVLVPLPLLIANSFPPSMWYGIQPVTQLAPVPLLSVLIIYSYGFTTVDSELHFAQYVYKELTLVTLTLVSLRPIVIIYCYGRTTVDIELHSAQYVVHRMDTGRH